MAIDKQCLKAWLGISFYEEKCKIHPNQHKTAYCGACMQEPVCRLCWRKEERNHKDHHPVLHVCIASWRASVKKEEMGRLMDVSKIQDYKINKGKVLYLNPNQQTSCSRTQLKCQTCTAHLIHSQFHYCSIACEVKSMDMSEDEKIELVTNKRKMDEECVSLRKRSRKGIPQRAPLQ